MKLRLMLAAAIAAAGLAAGAHYGLATSAAPTPTPKPSASPVAKAPKCPLLKVAAPNTLGGLRVTAENPCSTFLSARGDRALDSVALLGLRQSDNLLMATLEVGHFQAQAPAGDPSFQSGIINAIGDQQPEELAVGGETVYSSSSPGLVLVSWIHGRYLYVLAIRDTFAFPKTLLREALKVRG